MKIFAVKDLWEQHSFCKNFTFSPGPERPEYKSCNKRKMTGKKHTHLFLEKNGVPAPNSLPLITQPLLNIRACLHLFRSVSNYSQAN
jgi:hypothetical protein